MKITIETTDSHPEGQRVVMISVGSDDIILDEAMEMCKSALVAFGYVFPLDDED